MTGLSVVICSMYGVVIKSIVAGGPDSFHLGLLVNGWA